VKKLTFLAVVMALTLMLASSASADMMWWELTASCACEPDSANDFHLQLQVDSIDYVTITKDPCSSCTDAEITVSGEGTGTVQVDIEWIGAYVDKGVTLELAFSTNEEIAAASGYWTISGAHAADATISYEWSPDSPIPSLTVYGLIALAVLIALSGFWFYRKKRASAAT